MRKIVGNNIFGGITALLGIQRLLAAMYVSNIPFLSEGAGPLFGQALLLIFASAILFTIANVKKNPNRIPFFGGKKPMGSKLDKLFADAHKLAKK